MNVGVANTGGFDANQDILRADWRRRNILLLKREAGADEANSFHQTWPED